MRQRIAQDANRAPCLSAFDGEISHRLLQQLAFCTNYVAT